MGGVPSNATAVTGNLTVTGQTALGFLYVGPVAMYNPTSSTLNFPVGDATGPMPSRWLSCRRHSFADLCRLRHRTHSPGHFRCHRVLRAVEASRAVLGSVG